MKRIVIKDMPSSFANAGFSGLNVWYYFYLLSEPKIFGNNKITIILNASKLYGVLK